MATSTPEQKLAYVMTVLKNTDIPKPDYHAVAKDAGVSNANNAQKKFRAIIKSAGFDLVDGRIVEAGDKDDAAVKAKSTPSRKPSSKKAETATPSKKKRKIDANGIGPDCDGEEIMREEPVTGGTKREDGGENGLGAEN